MARNPFRSEAEAYRFVLLLVGYFAVIVAAKVLLGTWGALVAFGVMSVVALWWIFRTGQRERPERITPVHRGGPSERRILVIANETVGGEALRSVIRQHTEGVHEEVLVVAPALMSRRKFLLADPDAGIERAEAVQEETVERLTEEGVDAAGDTGEADPLLAVEDALATFQADEIVLFTHAEGKRNWLEEGVVEQAEARFRQPVRHLVIE